MKEWRENKEKLTDLQLSEEIRCSGLKLGNHVLNYGGSIYMGLEEAETLQSTADLGSLINLVQNRFHIQRMRLLSRDDSIPVLLLCSELYGHGTEKVKFSRKDHKICFKVRPE